MPEPTPSTARDHLRRVIEEFVADGSTGGEVIIDLTGSDAVVILPTAAPIRNIEPPPPPPASTVLAPVVNRARYRRTGIAGVSTRPGELSELATLVGPTAEPDLLRLVLAAQRRPRPPTTTPTGDPAERHPSAHHSPEATLLPPPPITAPAPVRMPAPRAARLPIALPPAPPAPA